jgi:hypothetical protein
MDFYTVQVGDVTFIVRATDPLDAGLMAVQGAEVYGIDVDPEALRPQLLQSEGDTAIVGMFRDAG